MLLCLSLSACAGTPRTPPAGPAEVQAAAASSAAATGSPVAARLAVYLRLLMPNGGSASEIAAFLHDNPSWPNRALLTARLDHALAQEPDAATVSALCATVPLQTADALARCAAPTPGQAPAITPALAAAARQAWIHGIVGAEEEAAFLQLWRPYLEPDDHWQRFERLEATGNYGAAARTLPLLSPGRQALGGARLALRRGTAGADREAAAVPPDDAADPALVLDLARWLRRQDRDDEALAMWRDRGLAAERTARSATRAGFWTERDALARELLSQGRDADALFLADDQLQLDAGPRLDADFLSGWIALRRLHDPAAAERHFAPLLDSASAITRSRGLYWTARARLARGDEAGAHAALAGAAALPTTFYGQMAAARLVDPGPQTLIDPIRADQLEAGRLQALREPVWTQAQALRFAGLELAQAAELLVSWNDPRHARAFLLRLDADATSDTDHALAASLADRLGLPDVAVAIARSAGRHGLVLIRSGWPRPYAPPANAALPPGLMLAIMRQESSFDPQITSPAGARGLMQLTTGTAQDTARGLSRPELTEGGSAALWDPEVNMTLGNAYLRGLLSRFGGIVPYAVAAYNAGPHRVDRWLAADGDPAHSSTPPMGAPGAGVQAAGVQAAGVQAAGVQAAGTPPPGSDDDPQTRMIDWIEMIPFSETRNYVQRVMENMTVYGSDPASRA